MSVAVFVLRFWPHGAYLTTDNQDGNKIHRALDGRRVPSLKGLDFCEYRTAVRRATTKGIVASSQTR